MIGDVQIHDPTVIEIDGQFVALGTGRQGPTMGPSAPRPRPMASQWTDAGVIGQGPPAWAVSYARFQALQRLGAIDQPARQDSFSLLLPVELRA